MSYTALVPFDGSVCARHALPFARAAGRVFGGRLVLLQALPPDRSDGQAADSALGELEGLVGRLRKEGIPAEALARRGAPAAVIHAVARERQADLIVMASHQRHGLDRWLHGSVTEAVVHGTRVPVLVVPHDGAHVPPDISPLRMLVPLDGSRFAEAALDMVRAAAAARPVDVLLVQVTRPTVATVSGITPYVIDREAEQDEAEAYLAGLAATLLAERIPARSRVVEQQRAIAPALLEVAASEQANVVVMATHGRGALAQLALGSVSTAVLEHSRVPVLLVPGRVAAHEGTGRYQPRAVLGLS